LNPVAKWVHRFVIKELAGIISPFPLRKKERVGVRVFIRTAAFSWNYSFFAGFAILKTLFFGGVYCIPIL
jgi:hypothetical protein